MIRTRSLKNDRFIPIPRQTPPLNNIVLIQQFHIPKDTERYDEIKDTLQKNVDNPLFKQIYLLNEKIYTNAELGFPSNEPLPPKLKQLDIKQRLTYYYAFQFAKHSLKNTYTVLSNNDIYYDDTLAKIPQLLKRTNQRQFRKMICLLRWELPQGKHKEPYLLRRNNIIYRMCQDSWIINTNDLLGINTSQNMNFPLGKLGCDNHIAYIFHKLLRFNTINCPYHIKSYHNHKTQIRYYDTNDIIPGPYYTPKIMPDN